MSSSYFRLYVFGNNTGHAIQSFDMIAPTLGLAALRARRATLDTEGSTSFELWQAAPPILNRTERRWLLALKEVAGEQQRVA